MTGFEPMKSFANPFLAVSVLTYHTLIPSATGAAPLVGSSNATETAIRPGSVISSPHGSRLETFNPMFPAGYYYGGPLNEQIGPKNAIILQPEVDLHPTATLGIYLKALFVWREDTADGLYNTPGFLILPGSVNSRRYVGASPQVLITQQLGRHLTVSLNYYHFYRGGFLTSQPKTKDVDYFSTWMSYTF